MHGASGIAASAAQAQKTGGHDDRAATRARRSSAGGIRSGHRVVRLDDVVHRARTTTRPGDAERNPAAHAGLIGPAGEHDGAGSPACFDRLDRRVANPVKTRAGQGWQRIRPFVQKHVGRGPAQTKRPFDPAAPPPRIHCPAARRLAVPGRPLFGNAALARYDTLHGIDARAVQCRGARRRRSRQDMETDDAECGPARPSLAFGNFRLDFRPATRGRPGLAQDIPRVRLRHAGARAALHRLCGIVRAARRQRVGRVD
ncbi:hypothetical protein EMIT0111MI5_40094 [Burkholderia sp. IT-111MI5]